MIFAAASLTEAFQRIAADFEDEHPDVDVVLNFAGSQSLRTQIEHGASPHVFASANQEHIQLLVDADLVIDSVPFATNEMVIVVPAANPSNIHSLADLANAERLVIAGDNVPAGAYAERVLSKANSVHGSSFSDRVLDNVVSRELNVRQALQKVVLNEADSALVYATDAASAGDKVRVIRIPEELNVVATYPIAMIEGSGGSKLAKMFVTHLNSDIGLKRLDEFGFKAPN